MAKDTYFSSQVCEQLARELVHEQAELLKHETLIRAIKAKIVEGKKQLIESVILGRTFKIDGKKTTVIRVDYDEFPNALRVIITLGLRPEDVRIPYSLTKKEKELINDYEDLLQFCKEDRDYTPHEAADVALELKTLKNGICLTYIDTCLIDMSNATTHGFFEESGFEVLDDGVMSMLEDLEIDK